MRLDHTSTDEDLAFRILGETDWEALRTATATVVGAVEDLDAKLTEAHKTIDELEESVARHQVEIDRLLVENNALSARIAELEAEVDGQADREKEDGAKLNS